MFDYSYNGLPFDWFGVNQEGQTDVVERIMNGMGETSRREHEEYIREYASHAADLLADNILNSGSGAEDRCQRTQGGLRNTSGAGRLANSQSGPPRSISWGFRVAQWERW